jgi:hypothetical protein
MAVELVDGLGPGLIYVLVFLLEDRHQPGRDLVLAGQDVAVSQP